MKRRHFITGSGAATIAALAPRVLRSFHPLMPSAEDPLTVGIVADAHKDLMPDADQRLETFISEAIDREVDMIIQLGDFCMAEPANQHFLEIWRSFKGPRYHVLGNHDMDKQSKAEMLDYWEMPDTYYSFDVKGFHFVVLDANFLYQDGKFIDYDKANFYVDSRLRTHISAAQIEWFEADLQATKLPTIVLSHQSLWHYAYGVKNRLVLQKIMERQADKIVCCLNGHNHIDYHHHQNGIDYLEINSMSYYWIAEKYTSTKRFAAEHYEKYKWLPNLAGYQDPLYAFATLDPAGSMTLQGRLSQWMSPSPYDLGMPKGFEGAVSTPNISDYSLTF